MPIGRPDGGVDWNGLEPGQEPPSEIPSTEELPGAEASQKPEVAAVGETGARRHEATRTLVSTVARWFGEREMANPTISKPPPATPAEAARRLIEERNSAAAGARWRPRPAPHVWTPVAEDYASALRLLRDHGWVISIRAGLGFAILHQREGDFTPRLARVLTEIEAYAATGSAWLKEDWLYLFDPTCDRADVSKHGLRDLDHVCARAPGFWHDYANNLRANQNVYHPGQYPQLQRGWEVLRVDLLPDPVAPYLGERPKPVTSPVATPTATTAGSVAVAAVDAMKAEQPLKHSTEPRQQIDRLQRGKRAADMVRIEALSRSVIEAVRAGTKIEAIVADHAARRQQARQAAEAQGRTAKEATRAERNAGWAARQIDRCIADARERGELPPSKKK